MQSYFKYAKMKWIRQIAVEERVHFSEPEYSTHLNDGEANGFKLLKIQSIHN